MRKEFAQARVLALSQCMILFALDELNMATTQLHLKFPGEEISNATDELFKLHVQEIPQRNAQLIGDKYVAFENLCRMKGQLQYLKGMAVIWRKSLGVPYAKAGRSFVKNQGVPASEVDVM